MRRRCFFRYRDEGLRSSSSSASPHRASRNRPMENVPKLSESVLRTMPACTGAQTSATLAEAPGGSAVGNAWSSLIWNSLWRFARSSFTSTSERASFPLFLTVTLTSTQPPIEITSRKTTGETDMPPLSFST
eukprot:2920250-Rhodomonas_salina.2